MWDIIVESNTFNFIIMLIILAFAAKKINLSGIINSLKQGIIDKINEANSKKDTADKKLYEAKELSKNLDNEIKSNIETAMQKAKAIENQILSEANDKVKYIENNSKNIINSEEKRIANSVINEAIKISADLAKNQIISSLKSNPKLHNKYIEESIKAIR